MNLSLAFSVFGKRLEHRFPEACELVVKAAVAGLSDEATADLARSLADSSIEYIQLPSTSRYLSSPSSGGPASLSTLLCPLMIAASGLKAPMLSSRGSVAGAIDSKALIPGFRTVLSASEFVTAIEQAGTAHIEPGTLFCPADRALIDYRRATHTMECPPLIVASLLGKQLTLGGPAATYDLRLGPSGNVGNDLHAATTFAGFLQRVAYSLGLTVAITITDNTRFPCSALGRLESLHLLERLIAGREPILPLDAAHLAACYRIAEVGITAASQLPFSAIPSAREIVSSGALLRVFANHLLAQGASHSAFQRILDAHADQPITVVRAQAAGYWLPPDLMAVRRWWRSASCPNPGLDYASADARQHIGLRLVANPGQKVVAGDPVLELRGPLVNHDVNALRGIVSDTRVCYPDPILFTSTHTHGAAGQ